MGKRSGENEACFKCGKVGAIFCNEHWFKKRTIVADTLIIMDDQIRLKDLFSKKNIIRWWIGTYALTLVKFPPSKLSWYVKILWRRLWYKLIERRIFGHWAESERLKEYLLEFGISENKIRLVPCPAQNMIKVEKKLHNEINIIYYYPGDSTNRKYRRWVYGKDIFERIQKHFIDVNWIILDGKQDIVRAYEMADGMIRLNRHDGYGRMRYECDLNEIPYYYNTELKPSVEECIAFIKEIQEQHSQATVS